MSVQQTDSGKAKRKIAIIGANEFQNPLIQAAKDRGLETHVFAWEAGDIGERTADIFHPISITDYDDIIETCRQLGIDGVATIASDLANITVAKVADALGLTANSLDCIKKSTDKELMRRTFLANGDPSPASIPVTAETDLSSIDISLPAIVKPADRSGSRGITKLTSWDGLEEAVKRAIDESFKGEALVEEFAEGTEYSVEYISWKGDHRFLAVTEKFTSGPPMFIERGHLEPARISDETLAAIQSVVEHALNSLGVEYGASHSELKIDADGNIKLIEIGSRMGGDCIGSHLVQASTGYPFVDAVIDVALGVEPPRPNHQNVGQAAIRFVFDETDRTALRGLETNAPELIVYQSDIDDDNHQIVDSGSRHGFFLFAGKDLAAIEPYLPPHDYERIS